LKVKVRFFAMAREIVGAAEQEIELTNGSSAGDLLKLLTAKNGEKFRDFIIDPKTGKPRSTLQFLIGDQLLGSSDGLNTILSDGAVFAIIPPVGGG